MTYFRQDTWAGFIDCQAAVRTWSILLRLANSVSILISGYFGGAACFESELLRRQLILASWGDDYVGFVNSSLEPHQDCVWKI